MTIDDIVEEKIVLVCLNEECSCIWSPFDAGVVAVVEDTLWGSNESSYDLSWTS